MNIPSINELRQSVLNDLRNKLEINTIIGKAVLNAFALVQAAKLKLYYLSLSFVYRNVFPDTADPSARGGTLERFGFMKLQRFPAPAVSGEYQVEATGEVGATIDQGTTLKSSDTATSPNKMFVVDSVVNFTSTTELFIIRAMEPGPSARMEVGDELQFTSPIANVQSFVEVNLITKTPESGEDIEDYRERVKEAYRIEAQGGAKGDYVLWSADVPSARRVYPITPEPGKIDVFVEATIADSIDGNGTPSSATLAAVKAAIDNDPESGKARRPMGMMQAQTAEITTIPIDVDILNLSDAGLLSSIQQSVISFLQDVRPYRDGVDPPENEPKSTLYLADIYDIVRSITGTGATFDRIDMKVGGVDKDLQKFTGSQIPYLESIQII